MTDVELRAAPDRYPMFKIQQLDPACGWVNKTRAGGTEEDGRRTLEQYRRNWPSGQYRLVLAEAFEGDHLERYTVIA
jgi:hypothetical protein